MSMHDEFDPFAEEGRDLLGEMASASFHASPDWWRRLVGRLDECQLEQLRAGELVYVALGADGLEQVRLEPPSWLFGDAAPLA